MKIEKIIGNKTDNLLTQVGDIADKLADRTKNINFKKDVLEESDLNDLKLHLGYVRTYADISRLKLNYYHASNREQLPA